MKKNKIEITEKEKKKMISKLKRITKKIIDQYSNDEEKNGKKPEQEGK